MDNTPISKLIRNIFFSFSEFERDMIIERMRERKARKVYAEADTARYWFTGHPFLFRSEEDDKDQQVYFDTGQAPC